MRERAVVIRIVLANSQQYTFVKRHCHSGEQCNPYASYLHKIGYHWIPLDVFNPFQHKKIYKLSLKYYKHETQKIIHYQFYLF